MPPSSSPPWLPWGRFYLPARRRRKRRRRRVFLCCHTYESSFPLHALKVICVSAIGCRSLGVRLRGFEGAGQGPGRWAGGTGPWGREGSALMSPAETRGAGNGNFWAALFILRSGYNLSSPSPLSGGKFKPQLVLVGLAGGAGAGWHRAGRRVALRRLEGGELLTLPRDILRCWQGPARLCRSLVGLFCPAVPRGVPGVPSAREEKWAGGCGRGIGSTVPVAGRSCRGNTTLVMLRLVHHLITC